MRYRKLGGIVREADRNANAIGTQTVEVGVVLRWTMAILMLGAAGLHFAAMGEHAGVSWTHGAFFAVVAWVQVGLAAWLILRPTRSAVAATVFVNCAVVVVWIATRTVGIAIGTDGTPEEVTFVDALCTVLEAVTIVCGGLLVAGGSVRRRIPTSAAWVTAGIVAAGVAALTTFGFSPAIAESDGHDHGGSVAALKVSSEHPQTAGGTAHGTQTAEHSHNPDQLAELQPDKPLDAETRATLAEQLTAARAAALRYPTVADAEQAGYARRGGFVPGAGAHYQKGGGSGAFDAAAPQFLIFDGISPTSRVVGLMYMSFSGVLPEGFAGPNDHWHRHTNVCIKYVNGALDIPLPADRDSTATQCSRVGGQLISVTSWMVHAWVVPGWESPAGVFSHANPNLLCADGTDKVDATGSCQGT